MQTPLDVGVDISKAEIQVCVYQSGAQRRVPNERGALLRWLNRLPAGSRIAMEASGGYEALLAELAHAQGFEVYVLNPKDVRHYAKSVGLRAKTDRVDAAVIARFIAHEHHRVHRFCPARPEQRQLQQWLTRRAKLRRLRTALCSSFKGVPQVHQELRVLLQRLDALVDKLDRNSARVIGATPERQAHHRRLQTIPGVAKVVGGALLATLERKPFVSADAYVAFLGLDPVPDESGTHVGRRKLSKCGPTEPRRLLYVAAMSAVTTKAWKPIYQRCLSRGLSRTEALVVLARRIARTAWSIYTHNTTFDPLRLQTQPIQTT